MKRLLRLCLLAVVLPAMFGCATMFSGMEAPEIEVINILPLESEGMFEQRAQVDLRIINPNDADLHIAGMSFHLDVNGSPFIRGVSNKALSVPRLGEAKTSIVVSTTVLDIFRQVMALDKSQNMDYAINGRLYLDGAHIRSVSFKHTGELKAER
jgi:LEA14-like dessication related protein